MNTPKITPEAQRIARLSQKDEFIREFNRQQAIHPTNEDAYLATEAIYQKLFPAPKYASFKSFEAVFYRYVNRRGDKREREISKLNDAR